MATTPPPYSNITGISRAVMKDNAQTTIVNYNGTARPGELVVNLETDPPALFIGNAAGALTSLPAIPGPYADDADAAAGGTVLGAAYYQVSGQVFVRRT